MEGDTQAFALLRSQYHSPLVNVLVGRGANVSEAEELVQDLWGECVPGTEDRPCLLEKFSGKCGFQNWLITVATNRLIDAKRKQARRKTFVPVDDPEGGTGFFGRIPGPTSPTGENALVELLKQSLEQAFTRCPSEGLLMLRLVFLHGLTQRELAGMWGCHEATISRALTQAMGEIEKITMDELKKRDGWLELSWQDFLELCQTQQIGFL